MFKKIAIILITTLAFNFNVHAGSDGELILALLKDLKNQSNLLLFITLA